MEPLNIEHDIKELQSQRNINWQKWLRIVLLFILGCEAAGALSGGILLIMAPNGQVMDMRVDIMHGVFRDFRIPGIILFGLGILNTVAFITVICKSRTDWIMAGFALGGLLIWFSVEIVILQELHWLHIVWGMPVYLGCLVAILLFSSRFSVTRKVLLICGILSSLLYFAMNILVPMLWPAYNCASQTVSELSAIGAPTRPIWLWLGILYTLFMILFAWGVWRSAAKNRTLRIAGALLIAYAALGILWPFASMHPREVQAAGGSTISDTMHIALAAVTEILYLIALGFAAVVFGKWFRFYSIATFLILMIFGVLTFLDAPGISANMPTPLVGVWERINIAVFLLWIVVLAIILLRADKESCTINGRNAL